MAYCELTKDFRRIRPYMRSFYVYGFRHRLEYDAKSARSYDNERRRVASWPGEYMKLGQDAAGFRFFRLDLIDGVEPGEQAEISPQLEILYHDGRQNRHHMAVSPQYLEYSEKDDRFRQKLRERLTTQGRF